MDFNVGIIGTNFGVSYHLPAFEKHKDFNVIGLAGNKFEKTKTIVKEHSIKPFRSWRDLIADDAIDVVSIATPPFLHYEMAMTALRENKHILLEKPTALNANQALEIMELAKNKSVKGVMSHEWRFYHYNQLLYDFIQKKEIIGEIIAIRAQDLLYYAFNAKYSWEYDIDRGGGWIGIAGLHIVDLIRYLSNSEFKEVRALHGIQFPKREDPEGNIHEVTAEDYFSTLFMMENQIHGIIDHLPTLNPAPPSRLIINGTEGTIYTEGTNMLIPERIYFANNGTEFEEIQPEKPVQKIRNNIRPVMYDLFDILLDQFILEINDENNSSSTLVDGWRNQLVLDAIKSSGRNGKKQVINID